MVSNTLGDDNVYILDNELFQSSDSSKPRAGVVNSWYSLLSGGDSSFETISLMADNNANASDFRENNDDKDVVFLFAGHYWYPMYLSKDNSDNVILTLWHANMSDERCLEYAQEIGIGAKDQECYSESDYVSCTFYSDVGYANGCLYVPVYSQCNGRAGDLKFADFGMKADSYSSPSNLYSVWWAGNSTYTSLEELWWYGELEDGTTLIVLSASSQWTRNGKSSLTHLLVTPSSMAWQENQSAKKILGHHIIFLMKVGQPPYLTMGFIHQIIIMQAFPVVVIGRAFITSYQV